MIKKAYFTMFNGGKLYHIFETEHEGRSLFYNETFLNEHAKEAFQCGSMLLKVDGACSCLVNVDGEWIFYERRDNHKEPVDGDTVIALFEGKQKDTYDQGGKSHHYTFVKMEKTYACGKGKKRDEVGKTIYSAIEKAVENNVLPNPKSETCPKFITCELVGSKHQGNRDGYSFKHGLIPHTYQFLGTIPIIQRPYNLEQFKGLVQNVCFEGFVFVHPDGTRYKLRSDMCEKSLWKDEPKMRTNLRVGEERVIH